MAKIYPSDTKEFKNISANVYVRPLDYEYISALVSTPKSTTTMLIFKYNRSDGNYDISAFTERRVRGRIKKPLIEEFFKILESNIENFVFSELQTLYSRSLLITTVVSFLIILGIFIALALITGEKLLMLFSVPITAVIIVQLYAFYRSQAYKKFNHKLLKRTSDIQLLANRFNTQHCNTNGIEIKIGKQASWIELHILDIGYRVQDVNFLRYGIDEVELGEPVRKISENSAIHDPNGPQPLIVNDLGVASANSEVKYKDGNKEAYPLNDCQNSNQTMVVQQYHPPNHDILNISGDASFNDNYDIRDTRDKFESMNREGETTERMNIQQPSFMNDESEFIDGMGNEGDGEVDSKVGDKFND